MFNKKSLKIILEKIAKANVLVIGDSMLDSYIIGNVERISPEAPIPIMKIEENFIVHVSKRMDSGSKVTLPTII